MAIELEPREYQDTPIEELPAEMAEEALEPESVEVEEHAIPAALRKILDSECILEDLTDEERSDIKGRVVDGYDLDIESMDGYMDRYNEIVQLAAMDEELGDKTFPFAGASKVMMPALSKACVEFNSRTTPEVVNRKDIANVKRWGKPSQDMLDKAERRALAINWQLKKGIDGWAKRTDRQLLLLPAVGQVFKKKWWQDGKIQECLITSEKMIYDHDADSFEESPRKSHWFYVDPNEFESRVRREYYIEPKAHAKRKEDKKQPKIDKPLELVESHCTLDLDGDGYCEPYIVTFCKCCDEVIKIERRFNEADVIVDDGQVVEIKGEEFFTQSGFIPSMDKPAVYIGWGDMLFDLLKSINTMMRQSIDAGTLANTAMNSGFVSSNLKAPGRTKSQRVELILGQFTKMDTGGGQSLRDMIWTPQFQGVNQSFYQLLTDMKNEIDQFTSASQSMDVSAGEAATLYLARLQQALKVPNAVTSRVYTSLTAEFVRIDDLMRRYMPEEKYKAIINWEPEVSPEVEQQFMQAMQMWQDAGGEATGIPPPPDPQEIANASITKDDDFAESFDLITTADPTLGSEQERITRAEIVATRASEVQGYNVYEAEKNLLQALGCTDLDKILPVPNNQPDPAAEAQLKWTLADVERMIASAKKTSMDAEAKAVETHILARDADLKEEMQQAQLDKLLSETMKNLNDIDQSEANLAIKTMEMARADLELEIGAQEKNEQKAAKSYKHPKAGDVSMEDIHHTAKVHGLKPEDVIKHLGSM